MKIFHGTLEIAGQMGNLCGALKKLGHIAVGYNIFHTYLGYREHLINTHPDELVGSWKHILRFFDLFHYHYNYSILPEFRDLEILKKSGKKCFMHHWGNDVRFHDLARINNPYVYTGDSPPNEEIHARLTKVSQYVDTAIVQDKEVYHYVKDYYKQVFILPLAINLSRFNPTYPSITNKKPLIIHAPTNPDFKGTAFIESAIERLQKTHSFDYVRVYNMSHEEVIKHYLNSDIIIDQILCGSHGLLSVEAMALGKPVLTYIRPDLVASFPELPVVNANPQTFYEQLADLINDSEKRLSLGKAGREYVEKVHSHDLVAQKLLEIYSQV